MKIEFESKFNIGEIRKIKGSDYQKFLITTIIFEVCCGGIQVHYVGTVLKKETSFSLASKKWTGTGYEGKEEKEEFSAELQNRKLSEPELE